MDPAHLIDRHTPVEEKIRLFRSLFRGREDIYARRFESRKTGRSGYAPACANEWVRGICEKPRIKCAECPHRRFLPVTDEIIRWHLSGADAEGKPFVVVDEVQHCPDLDLYPGSRTYDLDRQVEVVPLSCLAASDSASMLGRPPRDARRNRLTSRE